MAANNRSNLNLTTSKSPITPGTIIFLFVVGLVSLIIRWSAMVGVVLYALLILAYYLGYTHGFEPFWFRF